MKVISICQNKGGVGKTTTTINLGHLFSQMGKTLLIDLDSQANLSQIFEVYESELSIQNILDNPNWINQGIINKSDNLSIIPNNILFDEWKNDRNNRRNIQYSLKKPLELINKEYDYVLIDCPPSIDLPFEIALNASDYALILMDGHSLSFKGLINILNKIDRIIQEDITSKLDLKILGLIFSKYKEVNIQKAIYNEAKYFSNENNLKVFDTKIRENISIPESQAFGKNIFEYKPSSNSALDYRNLFIEIIKEIK